MPPLEFAPGAHFAAKGSAEADELYTRAKEGEFVVYSTGVGESINQEAYNLFVPFYMAPTIAISALVLEKGVAASANLEFDPEA